jgi:uncharacterized protein (TIGR02246 family)
VAPRRERAGDAGRPRSPAPPTAATTFIITFGNLEENVSPSSVRRTLRASLITSALALLPGVAIAQSGSSSASDSATTAELLRAVTAMDSALLAAEARGDTAAMKTFFAPDYYSVAPDGEMLGVRARLFRVAMGRKVTDSTQTLTAPWARRVGPGAVVVTRSARLWGTRGGVPAAGLTFRVTRLYVQRDGAWRLLFQQGTPLADEHVAGNGPGAPRH